MMRGKIFIWCWPFLLPLFSSAQIIHSVASKNAALYKVAVVNSVANADIKVFRCDSLNTNVFKNKGLWSVSEKLSTASIAIFWSDSADADIKIFLVDKESDAGWLNQSKKKMLSHTKKAE